LKRALFFVFYFSGLSAAITRGTPSNRHVTFSASLSSDYDINKELAPGAIVFIGQDLFLTLCYVWGSTIPAGYEIRH